jgi:hypothetical protein
MVGFHMECITGNTTGIDLEGHNFIHFRLGPLHIPDLARAFKRTLAVLLEPESTKLKPS